MGAGRAIMSQPDNPLHEYLLSLTEEERPAVCFLPTASGDLPEYIDEFYKTYSAEKCRPCHLQLFYREVLDLEKLLLEQDVIIVGGGNTANMLAVWKLHGVDQILRKAYQRGILLAGGSAGAICWFEGGISDSFSSKRLEPLSCGLGLLRGSVAPHYDVDPLRKPAFEKSILSGQLKDGFAIDDASALYFVNEEIVEVVSSQQDSNAYRVAKEGNCVRTMPASKHRRLLSGTTNRG